MATPREITQDEFDSFCKVYYRKACKLAYTTRNLQQRFSSAFKPCSGTVKTTEWAQQPPVEIWHFTKQPCDEYCSENMPIATCLVQAHDGRFYICRHKVGNCPWKK